MKHGFTLVGKLLAKTS